MVGLVLNYYASAAGIPTCAAKTDMPIFQDAATNQLWSSLGIGSGAYIVVDQTGNFPPPCRVTVTIQN